MSEIKISSTLSDKFDIRKSEDSPKHSLVVEYDLSSVNSLQAQDILLAAMRVKHQARLRKLSEAELARLAEMDVVKVDVVAEILTRQQAVLDPTKVADTCTDEQAAELLAKLMKRLNK